MSWQAWSLGDWNRALVDELFIDHERIDIPITRITASNAFLAGCTGDAACRPDEARASFIRAFGSSAAGLRAQFKAVSAGAMRQDGFPSIVAPLYLTLLAASADEATHDLGDFRRRFAEIVRPLEIGTLNFSDLPSMWDAVARWSKRRHRASRDCRVLVLPPPAASQYDKLIGFSKKLAFPAHRDESLLARLLAGHGLAGDVEPPLESVQLVILGALASFTDAFAEEYRAFSDHLVHARYKDAALTPFWGAVTDITWECARKEASASGSYRLVLDAGDPHDPLVYLLADQRGAAKFSSALQARKLPTPGKYEYYLESIGGFSPEPAVLARLGRERGLDRLNPFRYLVAGCVPFFPDELGRLCSDGTYYEDSPTCFLLRAEHVAALIHRARKYNLKHSTMVVGHGEWQLVLFESVSRGSLHALADLLPGLLNGMAGLGWTRPRPRLSGGAWCGQALLLNPASNPVARMAGATGGRYELLCQAGRVRVSGQLLEAGEDGFQVPHAVLDGSTDIVAARYVLIGNDEDANGELKAIVLGTPPSIALPALREPGAWLMDGRSGCMEAAFPTGGQSGCPSKAVARPHADMGHPYMRSTGTGIAHGVSHRGLDELPCSIAWLGDALHLRFQSRSTLPTREAMEHVQGVAGVTGLPSWNIWKLLHAGGWLTRIVRRTAPHAVSMANARTIALFTAGEKIVARIAGMLGEAECAQLSSLLTQGESASRICCEGPWLSLGAIEVELQDIGRMDVLAGALGLQLLDRQAEGDPFDGILSARFVAGKGMTGLPAGDELETWDPREWKWIERPFPAGGPSAGSLFRYRRSQASTYWVAAEHGHWKTDSEAWAWIFQVAAHGDPVGELTSDGNCILDRRARWLPPSLVRWWLHWGGGCVAISPSGQIVLCGAQGNTDWKWLGQWLSRGTGTQAISGSIGIALERRSIALKARLVERRRALGQSSRG